MRISDWSSDVCSSDLVGMEEASQLTLAALTPFKPELLTSASGESPLKILGRLASPISRPAPKFIKGASVSDQISADTVEFADDKTGQIGRASCRERVCPYV